LSVIIGGLENAFGGRPVGEEVGDKITDGALGIFAMGLGGVAEVIL